ncbi:MAG: UDP-3-O-acyl-N-acetylglucosamine deacetylase [Planctomycetia bacterium]|nr:UDP-3-O-acyl-N-acetylglucosamine deacetylase [Planctomycetia bacterium]
MRKQQTLAHKVAVEGFGFWSGRDVRLEFCPLPEGSGVRFTRVDLPGAPFIPARVEYRVPMPRQTSLANGEARVDMIEHVMAAVYAAEIDNCDIRVDGAEMPGLDGSSQAFFSALVEGGIETQTKTAPWREIKQTTCLSLGQGSIDIRPCEQSQTWFGYELQYETQSDQKHPIGSQKHALSLTRESYRDEIMNCRTFLLYTEAQYLVSKGLCQRVTPRDVLVFGDQGPVDNQLRFDNECARHKILDMIGDFALAGNRWLGGFFACRTGHEQNAQAVKQLLQTTELKS